MTRIDVRQSHDHVRISIHGHAEFARENDIVCSAISVLTYQLLNSLSLLQEMGAVKDLAAEALNGSAMADFKVIKTDVWDTAWMVIRIGYRMLEEQYPSNLQLTESYYTGAR